MVAHAWGDLPIVRACLHTTQISSQVSIRRLHEVTPPPISQANLAHTDTGLAEGAVRVNLADKTDSIFVMSVC